MAPFKLSNRQANDYLCSAINQHRGMDPSEPIDGKGCP